MSHYLITFLSGLTDASSLFVAAAGLTLVFGALRIINIAHGSFYAFGAFGVTTLVGGTSGSLFWLALVAVPVAVAVGLGLKIWPGASPFRLRMVEVILFGALCAEFSWIEWHELHDPVTRTLKDVSGIAATGARGKDGPANPDGPS